MAKEVTVIPATKIPRVKGKPNKSTDHKLRVAAYCRVSMEQEEQENSFKNQVDYYTRYINENPRYELAGVYADEGISGTNTKKREEFKRMIADCEAHKIDVVIITSISRFAQNTQDCLENYRKLKNLKNNGEVTQYYVKDSHEGIISREEWAATQQELERRYTFRKIHHFGHYGYGSEMRPFTAKIICGECGCIYGRKAHHNRPQKTYWQCNTRCNKGPTACKAENVQEEMIHRVFLEAWNNIVRNQEKMEKRWARIEKEGTELERLRVRQMRELVRQGPLKKIIPELVQTVLESILVRGNGIFEVRFLDRAEFQIKFPSDNV